LSDTLVFLFTDVEGSTRLWERGHDDAREALSRQEARLRVTVEGHGGRVFKSVGDGICAVFADARAAVAAAVDGQLALRREAAKMPAVRMAIHAGGVEKVGDDYSGSPLHHLSRVLDAAHGGQVVVTETARALAADVLPEEASTRSLGLRRLRDVRRPVEIHQVVHPELPDRFPDLTAPSIAPVPRPLTRMIGREAEKAAIRTLVEENRIVALTGPGGGGKTRLATELAIELDEAAPGSVRFVRLEGIDDPPRVASAVASAVDARIDAARDAVDLAAEAIGDTGLLLILDNCEHLVEGVAAIVARLLEACPSVRIVVTSREPLGLLGEAVFPVPPLSDGEAIRLFEDRARLVRPGFALDAESREDVARICRCLDGIPLAIELAAARARHLSPREMASRIGDRFRILVGRDPSAPSRHRTLRAAIEWSERLLEPEERALFRRLAVFVGGWGLEAAEVVARAGLDVLGRLVDKSLVVVEEVDGESRYRMFESIHDYAMEAWEKSGEGEEEVRRRHRDFFLGRAEAMDSRLFGPDHVTGLEWFTRERANLLAAIRWSVDVDEPESALRLAMAMFRFWRCGLRVEREEGIAWLERLAARDDLDPSPRSRALVMVCHLLGGARPEAARASARRALELARESGVNRRMAGALLALGNCMIDAGEDAVAVMEESLELLRAEEGEARQAIPLLINNLGEARRVVGDLEGARACYEEALKMNREVGDEASQALNLNNLGHTALASGRVEEALQLARTSLELARSTKFDEYVANAIEGIAQAEIARDRADRGVRLLGFAGVLRREVGTDGTSATDRKARRLWIEKARETLGEMTCERALAEGEAWSGTEAIAFALGEDPE